MNSKLIKAAVAGVAALALVGGGSTFAAWSDFGDIKDNSVGAGILKLNLNGPGHSAALPMTFGNLYPGRNNQQMVWIASNDGASVPNATLTVKLSNLVNKENGCSTNSEAVADPDCANPGGDVGELSNFLTMKSLYYPEVTTPEVCSVNPAHGVGYETLWRANQGNLNVANAGGPVTLLAQDTEDALVLAPGDGICIGLSPRWETGTPLSVNDNKAQGDSLSFDLKFTLNQKL